MKDQFIKAMRRLVYPVCIASTNTNGQNHAITASSVTSVSIEPPSLLVCINKSSSFLSSLKIYDYLYINFLDAEQKEIATLCSSRKYANERFEGNLWLNDENSVPYLRESQSIAFCQVAKMIEHDTHFIIVVSVSEVILNNLGESNPLLYCNGEYLIL